MAGNPMTETDGALPRNPDCRPGRLIFTVVSTKLYYLYALGSENFAPSL